MWWLGKEDRVSHCEGSLARRAQAMIDYDWPLHNLAGAVADKTWRTQTSSDSKRVWVWMLICGPKTRTLSDCTEWQ